MPQINGQEVGPIGFGMMGLTWRPEPCPQEQAFETFRAALDAGCNFWNGGEFYGPASYNSLVLIARYLEKYPEDADRFVLSVKGGIDTSGAVPRPDGSPEGVRRSLDNILRQLEGRTHHGGRVDVFECARRDPTVPLAQTLGTLQTEYAATGKLGGIALSEVSAATIHEAVATGVPIAAVEVEVSMWSTDVFTNGVAAACAQYDIPMVAYSPIGRGMLTGQFKSIDDLPKGDFRRTHPRFQPENFPVNLKLVAEVQKLAAAKGCTPAQLAINWVRCLSRRPGMPKTIIPIPGATTAERVRENAKVIDLTDAEMDAIDALLATIEVKGGRYPDGAPMNT
ncbi:aldo/keto reductase [Niveomyces insectorum RCEF 264]|uniref:Aldo/keto reductase n=1 Tax=Niveomyces insectorum RCEF 264 TaxID=1081102 RepID=A0A167PDT1_9HYPO|nr:aldo/keto reductase [Niveomyces insectorum RCEF 264]